MTMPHPIMITLLLICVNLTAYYFGFKEPKINIFKGKDSIPLPWFFAFWISVGLINFSGFLVFMLIAPYALIVESLKHKYTGSSEWRSSTNWIAFALMTVCVVMLYLGLRTQSPRLPVVFTHDMFSIIASMVLGSLPIIRDLYLNSHELLSLRRTWVESQYATRNI